MDDKDKSAEEKLLDELKEKIKHPMVGIRLDILRSIMDELDSNKNLQEIFKSPVCSKLGIVAEVNDLRFVEAGLVDTTDEQRKTVVKELDTIITKCIVDSEKL
ncbi:MAG: hypothetical protein ABH950_06975 [Candidatus Altiarchaeota archaeon]